jgi:hypothetical protein
MIIVLLYAIVSIENRHHHQLLKFSLLRIQIHDTVVFKEPNVKPQEHSGLSNCTTLISFSFSFIHRDFI